MTITKIFKNVIDHYSKTKQNKTKPNRKQNKFKIIKNYTTKELI